MSQDTFGPSGEQSVPEGSTGQARVSIDRFEMKRRFEEREEEEKVEEAAILYEKAARQWMPASDSDTAGPVDSEELETQSQLLRLRQKCQDIAALIMADEQGLMDSEDDE